MSGAPEQREFGVLAYFLTPHPLPSFLLSCSLDRGCLPWFQILQLCLTATFPLSLELSLFLPNQATLGASHCCQFLGVIVSSYPELCSPLCALFLPQLSAVGFSFGSASVSAHTLLDRKPLLSGRRVDGMQVCSLGESHWSAHCRTTLSFLFSG